MKTKTKDEAKTADLILEAAERIMAERGIEGLSMRAIGAGVGISQAAIYRHYKDKSELVGALVARGYGRIVADARRIAKREGPADELIAEALRNYIESSARRPELFKAVLLRPAGTELEGTRVLGQGVSASRESMSILAGQIERGMVSGLFARADPELCAQAIWAAMYGLTARIVLEGMPPGKRRKALIDREIAILVGGLKKPSARD